jgi:hypothetical protein
VICSISIANGLSNGIAPISYLSSLNNTTALYKLQIQIAFSFKLSSKNIIFYNRFVCRADFSRDIIGNKKRAAANFVVCGSPEIVIKL